MERFLKVFIVLAALSYFANKDFLQSLIYIVIGIEFMLMLIKELRARHALSRQGQQSAIKSPPILKQNLKGS